MPSRIYIEGYVTNDFYYMCYNLCKKISFPCFYQIHLLYDGILSCVFIFEILMLRTMSIFRGKNVMRALFLLGCGNPQVIKKESALELKPPIWPINFDPKGIPNWVQGTSPPGKINWRIGQRFKEKLENSGTYCAQTNRISLFLPETKSEFPREYGNSVAW